MRFSEEELLRRIRRLSGSSEEIERGIGDDGCVLRLKEGRYVLSQDMLVEGIDFERGLFSFEDVGMRAVYVNVSDILCMGAEPMYFLMSIAIPKDLSYREIGRFLRGIGMASKEFGLKLLGGDLSSSRRGLVVDICMVGVLVTEHYLGRDRAKAEDLIAVTGMLGQASFALNLFKAGERIGGLGRFVERLRRPRPPYEVWKELVKSGIPNAMIDISDGLLLDLQRLLRESGKGAKIFFENIPIPAPLLERKMEVLALTGGDDYELLFTFPKERLPLFEGLRERFPLHIIGEVTESGGLRMFKGGRPIKVERKGWDHFLWRRWTRRRM